MMESRRDCYSAYGFHVKTSFPFRHCRRVSRRPQIEILQRDTAFFAKILEKLPPQKNDPSIYYHRFGDESEYLRLFHSFHFWISSAGKKIAYQTLVTKDSKEIQSSLLSCLQCNVLSFAMMKMGIEPIHASGVVVDRDQAVAFLGDSGLGKSTLTAAFIEEGFPILTDDILALRKSDGRFMASPGTPCIKLFPKTADRIFKSRHAAAGPMYPLYPKLIFPLRGKRHFKGSVALRALYLLQDSKAGEKKIRLRVLTKQKASIELVKAAYNCMNQSPERLKRQLFFATELIRKVPVFSLTYPRDYKYLPQVRECILRNHRD